MARKWTPSGPLHFETPAALPAMKRASIRRLRRLHQGGARSPLDPPTSSSAVAIASPASARGICLGTVRRRRGGAFARRAGLLRARRPRLHLAARTQLALSVHHHLLALLEPAGDHRHVALGNLHLD